MQPVKLHSMVDDFMWGDVSDIIVAVCSEKLTTFLFPDVVFVDNTIISQTVMTKELSTRNLQLHSFLGSNVTLRKQDGSFLASTISRYPIFLCDSVKDGQWDVAVRLCRHIKMPECWA